MIDWTTIDTTRATDWVRLAELLCNKAAAAIQAADRAALSAIQGDLGEFAGRADMFCPPGVLTNVNAAARQVAAALIALDVAELETRSAKLDAAGAKVGVAAAALSGQAARLRLVAVEDAIKQLTAVTNEARAFRDKIKSTSKKDLDAKAEALVLLLDQLYQRFQEATRST